MIDLEHEELIRIPGEGRKLLPDPPSAPTWWRWINRGIGGRRLEVVKIGSAVYTTRAAFQKFAVQQGSSDQPTARSPRQREKAISKAERELQQAGA
jgi:hypothetical protein